MEGVPASAVYALLASLLIAIGSCIRGEVRFLIGLPTTLAGLAVASRAMWLVDDERRVPWLTPTCLLLFAMTIVGMLTPAVPGATWYDVMCRLFFVLGAIGVGVLLRGAANARRRAMAAIVVAATALQLLTPIGVPDPGIDVFLWTQTCLQALTKGLHPYLVRYPDAARAGTNAAVYPYMPATLIAYFPAFAIFGDCRFLSAVSIPAAVFLNRATGRRLGVEPAFVDATTLAFVLHPRGTWMTSMAWTEGIMVGVVAGFVYLAVRKPRGPAQAVAFFLLPALKQYMIAPVFLYVGTRPPRQRPLFIALAASIATLTVAPFLLWHWQPTVRGMFEAASTPLTPRLDSTSLVALVAVLTGAHAVRWLSVAVQFIVAAIVYVQLRRQGLGGVLLSSALTLVATFLAGWQSFVNYFYLAGVMLLTAGLVLAGDRLKMRSDEGGARRSRDRRAPLGGARAF